MVISCNKAFLIFQELTKNEVLGRTVYDFFSLEEAELHTQADKITLNSGTRPFQYHCTNKGTPLKITKSLIFNGKDRSPSILVIVNQKPSLNLIPKDKIHLTIRECKVLSLLAEGHSQRQIAKLLGLSHHTVADYLKTLYLKLGVHSRTQAQLIAITELGIRPERGDEAKNTQGR